jgi:LacI family transcriptional regulator
MRDVAALAGVGLKTVSRVVNEEPRVSPATRERVLAAIRQLDYRHDVNASLLRRSGRRTGTIGLVLEDVANPFMSSLHRSIEDFARERGVLVFAGSCDEEPARERELVGTLCERRVDGLVVVPAATDHSYLLSELRSGTAIVFADRRARFLDADSVTWDDAGGARRAVEHLASFGHRRIAYLGDDLAIATAEARLRGYREALAALGLEYDPQIVQPGLRGIEMAEEAALGVMRRPRPPTAVFASQNLVTIGAFRALRALDLHRRVALVGFDDFLLADLLDPPVTVVATDPVTMGRAAAGRLFARLDGERGPSEHLVLTPELVVRGSGEIAA